MEKVQFVSHEEDENALNRGELGEKSGLEDIKNTVAEKMHKLAGEVSEKTQSPNVPPSVGNYGRQVSEYLDQSADYVRDFDYEKMTSDALEYVKENPGFSLLMAGAAGFLIGLMFRR